MNPKTVELTSGDAAAMNNTRRFLKKQHNRDDMGEEFNNFMHKVTDVNNIVKKLASDDRSLQEMGAKEAEMYLRNAEKDISETSLDENKVELRIKSNRTVINHKAFENEQKSQDQMSQEAFMREIEKDAEMRYQDKKVRQEKSDTLKKQATLAFRRREFEKAYGLYTRAIEYIKDSCLLYTNRAICEVQLNMYAEALKDTEMALRLDENSLKGWLLSAKAHFFLNDLEKFRECVDEAIKRNGKYTTFVKDYVRAYAGESYEK